MRNFGQQDDLEAILEQDSRDAQRKEKKRKEKKRKEKKRKEKTTPFSVNSIRSPVIYRAPRVTLKHCLVLH